MMKRLALSAVLAFSVLPAAKAADLGNAGGIADLEERVAELEATAARKGNRKMTLVLYGQVDYAYYGITNLIGPRQNGLINNSASPSMLGVTGEAKLGNAGWKSGFRVEIQLDTRPPIGIPGVLTNEVTIRTLTGWIETPVGKVTLGHGSMASDRTGQVTLANTEVASRMLSLAPMSTVVLLGYDLPFNDTRRDAVRYDSPLLAGFILSGSIANGDMVPIAIGFNPKDAMDVALRYSGEAAGFRFAAAASYRDEQQVLLTAPFFGTRSTVTQGSASLMHMGTGLFANVAAGKVTGDAIWGTFEAYQVQAGIEKTLFPNLGATTIFGEWGEMHLDGSGKSPSMWGGGGVQAINGLSTDLFVDFKRYDATPLGGPAFETYTAGLRVKF